MMRGSEIRPRSAGLSLRRHSTNWQPKDCVTIASTSQHFVPRRARRCCQDETIMLWDSGRFVNWLAVGRVTARTGRRAPRQSPRLFSSTATTPLQSANGILRRMRSRDPPDLSIAGRTRSDSIISGAFLEAKPASSIRFWLKTTASSASRRRRISISMTRWLTIRFPGFAIKKRKRRTNHSSFIFQPARLTRHIKCQRNGATSTKANSTRAGTSCAKKHSHVRSSSG